MKVSRIIIYITLPIFLLMLFASLLTTKQYLLLSEGKYDSHSEITFDHGYVSDRVMGYLNYRYEDLDIGKTKNDTTPLFSETEIHHMEDVKVLYTILRLVATGALIIGISLSYYVYKKDRMYFAETFKYLYRGPLLLIGILSFYIIVDFSKAFTTFHELFFTNDDWILHSYDPLIRLLPTQFWMNSAIIIIILFTLSLLLINRLASKYATKITS